MTSMGSPDTMPLTLYELRAIAGWAAACAARVIPLFEAAAPDDSLAFLLVGAVVLIPIILAYTGYAYWVFRGKVDPEEGYH